MQTDVVVVLAHGGWADGSSWNKVIAGLRSGGVKAIAAPLPMTTLADDVAALDHVLERIEGPAVVAEEDRMIAAGTQRFMAERMKARVHAAAADHVPMITKASTVVDVLLEAVRAAAPKGKESSDG